MPDIADDLNTDKLVSPASATGRENSLKLHQPITLLSRQALVMAAGINGLVDGVLGQGGYSRTQRESQLLRTSDLPLRQR